MPEYLGQLDDLEVRVHDSGRAEKIRRLVNLREDVFFFVLHHGRKLKEISEEHHAHSAERSAGNRAVNLQEIVDPIQNIRTHHRNLVDDDRPELLDQFRISRPYPLGFYVCQGRLDVEAEKSVDRLPGNVDRRNAGRSQYHRLRLRLVSQQLKQRRFSGSGLAGDEQVPVAAPNVFSDVLEFRGYFNLAGHFSPT